jgi:hypothetical protein
MDCSEARSRFFELTLSHGDAEDCGESDPLRRHLDECAECRADFEAECVRDLQLAQTIQSVNVPHDLKSRLLRNVSARLAVPASVSVVNRPSSRRRRMMAAASLFGIAACLSLIFWMSRPVKLTLAELESLVERDHSAITSQPASPLERPSGWRQLASVVEQSESIARLHVGVVQFTFRPRGATGVTAGRLWVMPSARLAGSELIPDLATAEIQYRPRTTHLVWQESGTVYLLELGDDVSGLRLLHKAMLRLRTVA